MHGALHGERPLSAPKEVFDRENYLDAANASSAVAALR
jgi:hypothetical protein